MTDDELLGEIEKELLKLEDSSWRQRNNVLVERRVLKNIRALFRRAGSHSLTDSQGFLRVVSDVLGIDSRLTVLADELYLRAQKRSGSD